SSARSPISRPGGASAHGNEVTVSREAKAIGHRNPFVVLPVVPVLAQQLQVLKIQRHRRVVDVLGRQVHPVVDDLAAGPAPLTQAVPIGDVCRPGALPGFRLVEPPCPWFHGDHSKRAAGPAAGRETVAPDPKPTPLTESATAT